MVAFTAVDTNKKNIL